MCAESNYTTSQAQRIQLSSTTMFQKRIHKRVRFEADPILDREDSVTSEDEINKLTHESEVLEEDPLDAASGFGEAIVLSEKDFWDHVYSNVWSGRLRVCEGNLLRTLIRVRACSHQYPHTRAWLYCNSGSCGQR